jgi:hypothetical protein
MFWDENTQMTRIGYDEKLCYHSHSVPEKSKVTGKTALIEINVTERNLWLNINGKTN